LEVISLKQARRIALNSQLFDKRIKFKKGKEGIAQTIEHLGYVQIDTISVIERAHNHTLWTRISNYNAQMLHELLSENRRVFEYWGHAASYLPMCDYRFYLPQMKRYEDPHSKWEKDRLEKYGHMMKPVLERIRNEGALGSKDFEAPVGTKAGNWWDWRPTKVALEMLFWRGELMVTRRHNFHKIYDLTERVLPDNVDTRFPDNDELGQFFVKRALQAYGIAQEREMINHINAVQKKVVQKSLKDLIEAGEVILVSVRGNDKQQYALSDGFEQLTKLRKTKAEVHILSPFDNLIIQRKRIEQLFGFEYALECYVPAAKRVHGYFVLPIMWGEQFVGRLDAKADRKKKCLIIKKLEFEPKFNDFEHFLPFFVQKLKNFASFNGCDSMKIEQVLNPKIRDKLRGML